MGRTGDKIKDLETRIAILECETTQLKHITDALSTIIHDNFLKVLDKLSVIEELNDPVIA